MTHRPRRLARWLGLTLAVLPALATAQAYYAHCPPFLPELPTLAPLPDSLGGRAEGDALVYTAEGHLTLSGSAWLQRPGSWLGAQRIDYWREPERARAEGELLYRTPEIIVRGVRGEFEPGPRRGWLDQADYWLPARHARGRAERVEQLDEQHYRLDEASYTTCPAGQEAWRLDASDIRLDRESGRGEARDTTLTLGGRPVLWLPYMNFPIDDRRQSGFLYPMLASSGRRGLEIAAPYYINIAPNMDATLTPRLMSKRGLMLGGEFRYLHREGHGEVALDWMPWDAEREDGRYRLGLTHEARWQSGWQSALNIRRVSDRDYFTDFANTFDTALTDHLASSALLTRQWQGWNIGLLAQGFQTVNRLVPDNGRPYQRLPQLTLSTLRPLFGGEGFQSLFEFEGEAVNFTHPVASLPHGGRYRAAPALRLPLRGSYYLIEPRLALDATHYQLDKLTRERVLPIASLDARLYFEGRHGNEGRYLGRLTPRLFYLNVPARDQSMLPVFDTTLASLSFAQLFRHNRYNGVDRIGDANQLTWALSWDLVDTHAGRAPLGLALGQQYRFQDTEVTLGEDPLKRGFSNVVGEISSEPLAGVRAAFTAEYDRERQALGRTYTRLTWRGKDRALINLGYSAQPDSYRQADIGFSWPATPHWNIVGRHAHALDDNQPINSLIGFEYDSCCWLLRVVAQRYVVTPGDPTRSEHTLGFMLQLELKGLGSLGQSADRTLQNAILGYQPLRPE